MSTQPLYVTVTILRTLEVPVDLTDDELEDAAQGVRDEIEALGIQVDDLEWSLPHKGGR